QGLSTEVVTAGKRTTISDILAFNRIDNLDTVAGTIDVLATPTAYLDVATNTADMVYTCTHDTAYAHTYANGSEKGGKKGKKGKSVVGHLPVVHLSFFDGIGVSSEALRRISTNVLLTLSWENNEACADFTHERFGSIQMGDVTNIDIDQTVAYIDQRLGQQDFIVLITAGPPCPDFSRLKKSPKGVDGETGWLFQHMIDVEYKLRLKFKGRPVETVIENVLPHHSLRDQLLEMTKPLCMPPIVIDAADGGLIHRKRLWWTSIDWQDVEAK
ncbi:unnamed protein product, partial [Symbiodinium microadriaticum]